MAAKYEALKKTLQGKPQKWLVTGVAGFIGSNLAETLLKLGQEVVGLDDFSTGHRKNLEEIQKSVGDAAWKKFKFLEGSIADAKNCADAVKGVQAVLHQAAIGSVPRSIKEPLVSHAANVDGFLNMIHAAKEEGIKRFVYASSSSVYGDHPGLPKVEDQTGNLLSPYALTKKIDEQYAEMFQRCYGFQSIGLRYFNVFGARQDPNGPYAAVIPLWIKAMLKGEPVFINGDGETSRDFCYIENVVSVNLLAAMSDDPRAWNQVYNVAAGQRTTLKELFQQIRDLLAKSKPELAQFSATYRDFREGDIRHSLANIDKAKRLLGYEPIHDVPAGLRLALEWYKQSLSG